MQPHVAALSILCSFASATVFGQSIADQCRGMKYDQCRQMLKANAEQALADRTFPELEVDENIVSPFAIGTTCDKYPKGPVRQTCLDAGKIQMERHYQAGTASTGGGPSRSIAEQAREVQAATAAREAADADKEAAKQRFRELKYQLSGWDEHNAYDRCMQERDHSAASNPAMRDVRDRRQSEPIIPALDLVETCVTLAKQQVAEEGRKAAEQRAADDEAARIAQEQREACQNSDAHQLAMASRLLVITRDLSKVAIDQAREDLERDKEVERLTGVADLKLRHEAGSLIVDGPAQLATQFTDYRALGGTARSIEDVEEIPDPCRDLR